MNAHLIFIKKKIYSHDQVGSILFLLLLLPLRHCCWLLSFSSASHVSSMCISSSCNTRVSAIITLPVSHRKYHTIYLLIRYDREILTISFLYSVTPIEVRSLESDMVVLLK